MRAIAAVVRLTSCPWNRFAQLGDPEFSPRHGLDDARLVEVFAWTEAEFDERLAGNPIRRIGHTRWLRNIAVALGNALRATGDDGIRQALAEARAGADALVQEHIDWAVTA